MTAQLEANKPADSVCGTRISDSSLRRIGLTSGRGFSKLGAKATPLHPMKKKSTSQSAPARRSPWLAVVSRRRRLGESGFFNFRVLLASVFCLASSFIALGGAGLYLGSSKAQAQPGSGSAAATANSANGPDIVRLVGPVAVNTDLQTCLTFHQLRIF